MDRECEAGLAIDPWNSQFHADLGDAARERGFIDVAQFAYEQAIGPDGSPRNTTYLIELREIYLRRNNLEAADALLERIRESKA